MPKKRKPSLPAMPVEWVDTPAQRAGCIIEEVRDERAGIAKRKRRYRQHQLEAMVVGGRITRDLCDAGLELHARWCATQLTPAPQVKVDKSARPDESTILQVQRMHEYAALAKRVPKYAERVVRHVVLESLPICALEPVNGPGRWAELENLVRALQALAGAKPLDHPKKRR